MNKKSAEKIVKKPTIKQARKRALTSALRKNLARRKEVKDNSKSGIDE